jgi:hypothetical protein
MKTVCGKFSLCSNLKHIDHGILTCCCHNRMFAAAIATTRKHEGDAQAEYLFYADWIVHLPKLCRYFIFLCVWWCVQ